MMIQFDILAKIGIHHDYFAGGLLPTVNFIPSRDTEKRIADFGLVTKMNRGYFEIGIEVEEENEKRAILEHLQEPFELIFTFSLNDHLWSNYTEQLPDKNSVYYFSNESTLEEENIFFFHEENRVGTNEQINVFSERYVPLSNEDNSAVYHLGNEKNDCSFAIQSNQNEKAIDMRPLEEGCYSIESNGESRLFFYLKDVLKMDGIVHLKVDPTDSVTPLVDEQWQVMSPEFRIHFKNRSTLWRYHFPKNKLEHLNGLRVTNGSKEELFSEATDSTAPNGQVMCTFTSLNPIELQLKPTHLLQLKKNVNIENRSEGVILDRLPAPSKENLYRVGDRGETISDLFINL